MNLNYNYVQDLSAEKLQCWFTPRAETKTHSDLPGTLNLTAQTASYFTAAFSDRSLFIGRKSETCSSSKKRQKNQMHILGLCCIFHHLWHDLKEHSDYSVQEQASLFRIKSRHFYLGREILKHICEVFLQGRKVPKWSFRKHSCTCVWESTVKLTIIK